MLTREEALAKFKTEWWKTATPDEIAEFQLGEQFLCCPWILFQKAVQLYMGRPVWTHEFADPEALKREKRDGMGETPLTKLIRMSNGKEIIDVQGQER
jgi:hypothetical protein